MIKIVNKNKKTIVLIIILLILINILNVVAPYVLKLIIDEFSQNIVIKKLIVLVSIYLLVKISIILVKAVKNKKTNFVSNKMLSELRDTMLNKILAMKLETFNKFSSSDIYTRLTLDAENVKLLFSDNIPVVLNDVLHMLLMIIVMLIIDIKLALIGITIIAVIAGYSFLLINKLRKIDKIVFDKRDLENRQYSEDYNKSKLTKFFSLEEKNIEKINNLLDEELKNRFKYTTLNSFLWPIGVFLESIGIYAILYYALNINTTYSLGTIYIFLYYIKQCFNPLKEIFNQIEQIQESTISLQRINTILQIKEKEDIYIGYSIDKFKGNIEFEDVSFTYGKKHIFKNATFKINQGEKVAIIGKTGAGKTTITQALMRLYPIKDGIITIDGFDIEQISIESIRHNISYISQNAYVLNDTLRRNILLDKTDIRDEQILDIIDKIGANPLLSRLENGLDEVINTNRLSKGELQIIAFIRAIIHDASIYIFDEPTSNIDLRTEKMIQSIIDKISKTSTVLIIAHRLATIKNVDKIIEIKDGSVKVV
ncbi:MAG: ABC transporter ATP-binding protein [Clostridia bacterium]|nr:ABC transporter ATP-binding protein [Clostridia bacterium]